MSRRCRCSMGEVGGRIRVSCARVVGRGIAGRGVQRGSMDSSINCRPSRLDETEGGREVEGGGGRRSGRMGIRKRSVEVWTATSYPGHQMLVFAMGTIRFECLLATILHLLGKKGGIEVVIIGKRAGMPKIGSEILGFPFYNHFANSHFTTRSWPLFVWFFGV